MNYKAESSPCPHDDVVRNLEAELRITHFMLDQKQQTIEELEATICSVTQESSMKHEDLSSHLQQVQVELRTTTENLFSAHLNYEGAIFQNSTLEKENQALRAEIAAMARGASTPSQAHPGRLASPSITRPCTNTPTATLSPRPIRTTVPETPQSVRSDSNSASGEANAAPTRRMPLPSQTNSAKQFNKAPNSSNNVFTSPSLSTIGLGHSAASPLSRFTLALPSDWSSQSIMSSITGSMVELPLLAYGRQTDTFIVLNGLNSKLHTSLHTLAKTKSHLQWRDENSSWPEFKGIPELASGMVDALLADAQTRIMEARKEEWD
jgi:hypothetical protein